MSKTIDQRVVEMRFDNKHFESNVRTSMSTIDKLKQSLNFSGASKSLDSLNKAASGVNMTGLGGAVDTVSAKFSALQVMGVTALANITNSAVNAGKRMVSALTIDPVKTGFQEYETQINSVQTILANTSHAGTTIDDVNKSLDELNKYADETIYNFTEMTRNIGTFTAAGVDLDTSVASIKGIANLAAVSGSTSQQASTAMYQLSQALAAGKVSLMDWNSVVNAGMGGKVFQDALIRTSELLGTGAKAAIEAHGSFRESLTRGEWLTTEVLTETLQQFAGAYSEADLIAQGFTKSQAKEIAKMAETAKSVATDVKTFTQLWDVMKESAQSGWSQTWKLLIGDMEDAKKLLRPIAEFFTGKTGLITKISEFRNKLLEGALSNPFTDLLNDISGVKGATEEVTKAVTDFSDIVNRVIGGEFGNGQARWDKLTEAGYDWAHVQNLVNEKLGDSTRHATNYKEAQEEGVETQKKVNKSQAEAIEQLAKLSDAELEEALGSKEAAKALRTLQEQSEKTGIPIKNLVEDISLLEGRTLLINSFKNVGKGLIEVFKAIRDAWQAIYPPKSMEERVTSLYDLIAGLHKFTTKLTMSGDTADKVTRIFKGVFAALDLVANVTGGALKIAFKIITGLFKEFGIDALEAVAVMADGVVTFRDWINESLGFSDAINGIVKLLAKGIRAIYSWLDAFKQTDTFKNIIGYFKDTGEAIRNWIAGIKEADNIPQYILEGLVTGLKNGVARVANAAIEIGRAIVDAIKNFLGIHSPSTVFIAIGGFIIAGLVMGLTNGLTKLDGPVGDVASRVVEFFKNIDWGTLFSAGISTGLVVGVLKIAKAISAITAPLEGVGDVLSGTGEVLEKSAKPIAKVLKSTAKVVKSFAKVMNSIAFKKNTEGIKNIAISLGILVAAIAVLSYIDVTKLWNAVGVVATLALILGLLAVVVNKINETSIELDKGGLKVNGLKSSLLGIGIAILALAVVAKLIGSMNSDQLKQGMIGLAGIAGGILLFMLALAGIAKIPGKTVENVGSNLLRISGAIAILAIVAKLMAGMTWGELGKATVGLAILLGCVATLMLIGLIPNRQIDNVGLTILAVSGAMIMLGIVAKLVGGMEWNELGKAAVGLIGLGAIIAGLIYATRFAGGNNLKGVGSTLLMMSVAIGILALVTTLLGFLKLEHLVKGLLAVGVLATIMKGLIVATKDANDCKANLIVMTVAIGVMAAAIAALSFIDPAKLASATAALGLLMGMFALMTLASGKAGVSIKSLVVMTVAVGVLGSMLIVLSKLEDPTSLLGTAAALSLLLITISGALFIVSKSGSIAGTAISNMLLLGLVVAELALILGVMSALNVEPSISTAAALSIMLGVMAGVLILISNIGKTSTAAVGNMLLLGLVVAELALILGVLSGLNAEPSISTAIALSAMLVVMAGVLVILSAVGPMATGAVGSMMLLGLVIAELAIVLGLMSAFDVNPSIETAAALSLLLVSMSGALVLLSAVGLMGPAAFVGVGALATLIAGIGGLIVAIGALVDKFPVLETFLDTGIPIIEKIGTAIGSFFGNIAAGFMDAITSALPGMATDLSNFMTNLQPFIEGAKNISSEVITGIGYLSAAIIALTVADLIQGIGSFLTLGSSLGDLGTELSSFITNAMPFIAGASLIKPEMLTGVQTLADVVLILTAANILEGLTSWFTGGSSLAEFGAQLPQLGTDLNSFATNLGAFDETKVMTVKCATDAIKALASAAEIIPNEGGLWASIVGDNSLATFGSYLPGLATNLNSFATNLGTFDDNTIATVGCAADAIVKMAKAAEQIPNDGGLWASIVGDNSLASFGNSLPELGTNLGSFATNLGTFNKDTVTTVGCAADAIVKLANAADQIPNTGGLWSLIVGDNSLATFGGSLPDLGTHMNGFVTNLGTFDDAKVATVKCAGDAIVALANASEHIDGQSGWAKAIFGDNSLSTFSSQFGTLGSNLKNFVTNLGSFSESQVSTVKSAVNAINAFANLADSDLKGAKKNLEGFGDKIVYLAGDVSSFVEDMPASSSVTTAITSVKNILKMIEDIGGADTKVATNFTKSLKDMGKAGVKEFVTAFTSDSAKKDVKAAGVELINQVSKGAESKKDDLKKSFGEVAKSAASGAKDKKSAFEEAGKAMADGFASGISANDYKAKAKAKAMAEAAVKAAREALKINSPSKVFREIGTSVPEGFAMGIGRLGSSVRDSSNSMADTAITSVGKAMARIIDMVNSDIDTQPTIRPVVDMTDVRNSANTISSLFGGGTSVGVVARVNSINSTMNESRQNGADTEVVSAINDLRRELGKVKGDTYSINGITYDDGSAVSEAIKVITRAAIRERRT